MDSFCLVFIYSVTVQFWIEMWRRMSRMLEDEERGGDSQRQAASHDRSVDYYFYLFLDGFLFLTVL